MKYRSSVLLTLLGISVSIFVFIAQGPYINWWQYILPAIPLIISLLLATIIYLLDKTKTLRNAAILLKSKYDLMTSVRGQSHMLVRITNNNGDIDFEREYSLELVKDVRIETTKLEHISSEVPIQSVPPPAQVLHSTNSQQDLLPEMFHQKNEIISDRDHTHYSWYYRIQNPLKKKGDKIGYRYKLAIPRSEALAFSDQGGLLFIECGALEIRIKVTLIAPPGYSIDIINCKAIDYDGAERQDVDIPKPKIDAGNEVLNWSPTYAHGIRYVCNYRCVQK